ncbi:uncharacterized protein LOC133198035 [Saccostrea echinata]|uniref:uncharacterized protein LOC133198035 n=1 Tax=Saccostrea echinata TaxID=191078 RepID=UPI002A816666|nr:uncharacterized protein LOC133198035 [Saccostrea echinata]
MDGTLKEWNRLVEKFHRVPKLVLSVIGDSDSFVPRAWPKSVFQTALIETHKSSGGDTWILYGNKNVGVSKVVRDAADVYTIMEKSQRNDEIILIGTSPDSTADNVNGEKGKNSQSSDVLNLTSVLQLEEFIQNESSITKEHIPGFAMHVPIVIILVEGGLDDIKHVAEAVHSKVPVIVIKGSGKAADITLDYLEDERNLRSQAALLFGLKFDDSHFEDLRKNLVKLKERRWMVSKFDTENDDPLMLAKLVGEAVVRGWALEEVHVIEVNLSSYPRRAAIYDQDQADKVTRPVISLSIEATGDKTKTIDRILESFRTEGYVVDSKFTSPPSLPLYFYVGYQVLQEHHLLMECGPTILCTNHPKAIEECDCLGMMWLMKSINRKKTDKCFNKKKVKKAIKAPKTICRELLDYKMTGLVCYEALRKLSEEASDVKEQNFSKTLLDHAQLFYTRTLALLDCMYETDSSKTLDLLDDSVDIWGIKSNPLTFAYENFMYEFVAKPASQKHLNKTWYRGQAPHFIPCIKVLFLTMLVSYSAFVSTSISTRYYTRVLARAFEYYVYFWGFGDLLEELFTCFGIFHDTGIDGKSYRSNWTIFWRYLNNFWNIVDLLSYALLITALFVRHMHPSETFTVARRMFSLSLLIMYLRFLEAFLMVRTLGPTLIMIKEMLKDLFAFIILLAVVIFGVGFYYHANLWPDHVFFWEGRWTDWRIWKVIYYPYWQLYGETFNDFLQGPCADECTANETIWSDASEDRCPREDWTVGAVSALYMLFSNLLLVNLVIAMFSSTYERVTANAENLWRFERYTVIMNYKYRVPSPVNLVWTFYRIYRVITFCTCGKAFRSCCCGCCKEDEDEKTKEEIRKKFQRIMAHRRKRFQKLQLPQ